MTRQRLNILIYHRVLNDYDPLRPGEPSVSEFDKQMKWISRCFNVIDLSDAVKKMKYGELPPRSLSITFDDGYKDNYENAFPILKKYNITATFFIATGFLDGSVMWNDIIIEGLRNTRKDIIELENYGLGTFRVHKNRIVCLNTLLREIKYLPESIRMRIADELPQVLDVPKVAGLMMNGEEIRNLYNEGMGIGAHTVNHPILSRNNRQDCEREIVASKEILEEIIDNPVTAFAYPNGKPGIDYDSTHTAIVRNAGFDLAVSTVWGVADKYSDIYQLPRFTPWDNNIFKYIIRLAKMRIQ